MTSLENDMAETLITLTSDIVAAHVSNNSVSVDEVATLIQNVYGALASLAWPRRLRRSRSQPCRSGHRSSLITLSASKTARR